MGRLEHMLALLALAWFYTGVLALVFWLFGMADCRATFAAFAFVTVGAVFWSERTYGYDPDSTDEAGA